MSDAERGRTIMRYLVDLVVREGWHAGAQWDFALQHFGIIFEAGLDDDANRNPVQTRQGGCGEGSPWFCSMYHQAPDPNAAAYTRWFKEKAYADLAKCQSYRATFAWQVARSRQWRDEARENDGVAYEIDDSGAVVSPADHRPEAVLAVGSAFNGAIVERFEVRRGPRLYMEQPDWFPSENARQKKGAVAPRVVQVVNFAPDITAHVEFAAGSRLIEKLPQIFVAVRDLTLPAQLDLFAGAA